MNFARNARSLRSALLVVLTLLTGTSWHSARGQKSDDLIRPGDRWLDDRGVQIQAHGGGIIHIKNTWYWFGEDRSQST